VRQNYYQDLIKQLSGRATQSTLSMLGISNEILRNYLEEQFNQAPGQKGSYLADPVFEATFGWKQAEETMADLAGGLLSTTLVEAMDNPPKELKEEYSFKRSWHPYDHQLKAWKQLTGDKPQSAIVTSGTGSGKTECFLVPVLDSLTRQAEQKKTPLVGVQALFLYPLNALINSQRDRLRAWTHGLDGNVKFCLYNGMTPQKMPVAKAREHPSELQDRSSLRATPPPLLVTNATMLEYMLVRQEDAPILKKSQGMLKWIILDEAHTYLGSQAAELSLLLRRVMHGFGVSPKDVRFIATSATIGIEAGAEKQLAQFLADLGGIDATQVTVIGGNREMPPLDVRFEQARTFSQIKQIDAGEEYSDARFEKLCAHPIAKDLRAYITKKNARSLKQIQAHIKQTGPENDTLAWLDLCSGTSRKTKNGDKETFLPLRAHIFHRVTPGIWVCPNQGCSAKQTTGLTDEKWPYGMVYLEHRDKCQCGTPVFDLVSCNECGSQVLRAEMDSHCRLKQKTWEPADEFSLLGESDYLEDSEEEEISLDEENDTVLITNRIITSASGEQLTGPISFDPETNETDASEGIRLIGAEFLPNKIKCPDCETMARPGRDLFRRRILGAPFHLGTVIPTTLEYCPEGKNPLASPNLGKRLITFTDSRQGTARIAVRQQQDAERNSVRSFVYHALRNQSGASPDQIEELDALINELKPLAATNNSIATVLKEKLQERTLLAGYQPISWDGMLNRLAEGDDVKKWMHRYYQELDRETFGKENVRELAGMLLAREFSRRPTRQNSLETMGLITLSYPALKDCKKAPTLWGELGCDLEDWKDFLKICLDFHVRGNTFINLPDKWARWSGNRFFSKRLLNPASTDNNTTSYKKWPQFRRGNLNSRLVRLLFHSLNLNTEERHDQDICDDLLTHAWNELKNRGLLHADNNHLFYLPLSKVGFRLTQKAWVCPVTGRFLDVTLKGITPYLPRRAAAQFSRCSEPLLIPIFDTLNIDDRNQALELAQTWLKENKDVGSLRQRGLWSDLSDRIIEGARFFRVAEHSAQQPGRVLSRYEKWFKEEKLNVLSCSTTMEMGVDIGGISTVAMNNVPPHPANYLQRAGRAGRRGEARSTAITVCKDNAHEQMVFANTKWAFETDAPLPYVSLNSVPIVQRHINSMLLSTFFKSEIGEESFKLTSGNFFLNKEDETSRVDQFLDWCARITSSSAGTLLEGLNTLQKGTILENSDPTGLINETQSLLSNIKEKWCLEREILVDQVVNLQSLLGKDDRAVRAVEFQKKRMEGEYLLSELANSAFLPAYGFPLHVTSLNIITKDQLKLENKKQEREDNRLMARDLPARDAATAIREYAPGAEIILDGKVYKSCGLSLTWKTPMNKEESKEPQDFRLAWRCRSCGATGTERNTDIEHLTCAECGETSGNLAIKLFIQPSGYTVDFYEEPHNDVTTQTFLPVKEPWVSITEEWLSLPNPSLGRARTSRQGQIFAHSSGLHNHGYSLCLGCGRAESQEEDQTLPKVFAENAPHYSPRYKLVDHECQGSNDSWLIKRDIHLGFEYQTDVFELQLKDQNGHPINDVTLAFTLATALRRALASKLGIDEAELGHATIQRQETGVRVQSIVLFDTNSGGSGYSSQAYRELPSLLQSLPGLLECPADCDKTCHQCLLSYDTRFHLDELDRKKALEFLLQTQLLNRLDLPEESRFFGKCSQLENQPVVQAIQSAIRDINASRIHFFFDGGTELADIAASPFFDLLLPWASEGKKVSLILRQPFFDTLDAGKKLGLIPLISIPNIEVLVLADGREIELDHNGKMLCEVLEGENGHGRKICWATSDIDAHVPGADWGTAANNPVVRSNVIRTVSCYDTQKLTQTDLFQPDSDHRVLEIHQNLDGPIRSFGERFWGIVNNELPSELIVTANNLRAITYNDRYICCPLSAALLLQIINFLVENGSLGRAEINTAQFNGRQSKNPRLMRHNWERSQAMENVLYKLLLNIGVQPQVNVLPRNKLPHARSLVLEYENDRELTIYLDQGMGYWRVMGKDIPFNFQGNVDVQVKEILSCAALVEGSRDHATYIAII